MSVYVVVGYRWDCTNEHQYVAFASTERDLADAFAMREVGYRGGKYGFAVFLCDGEEHEMVNYYPSINGTDGVRFSWVKYTAELVGYEAHEHAQRGEAVPIDRVLKRFGEANKAEGIQGTTKPTRKDLSGEQDQ